MEWGSLPPGIMWEPAPGVYRWAASLSVRMEGLCEGGGLAGALGTHPPHCAGREMGQQVRGQLSKQCQASIAHAWELGSEPRGQAERAESLRWAGDTPAAPPLPSLLQPPNLQPQQRGSG